MTLEYESKKNEIDEKIPDFPLQLESSDCQLMKIQLKELEKSWNDYYEKNFKEKKHVKEGFDVKKVHEEFNTVVHKIKEFQKSIIFLFSPKSPAEITFATAGLWPRLTPHLFISLLIDSKTQKGLIINQNLLDLIGAIVVLWTLEQRLVRIIQFSSYGDAMKVALTREIENKGHENWSPKEHPEWLLLELGLDLLIRPIQVEIAKEMISPKSETNTVMQLNMGEGKTSVIVPLLCVSLADGEKLVQITVLKSLFKLNYGAIH